MSAFFIFRLWLWKSAILIYSSIMPSHTCKWNEMEKRNWKCNTKYIRKSFILTMSFVSCVSFEAIPGKKLAWCRAYECGIIQNIHFFRAFMLHLAVGLSCLVPKCVCWSDCNNKFHAVTLQRLLPTCNLNWRQALAAQHLKSFKHFCQTALRYERNAGAFWIMRW